MTTVINVRGRNRAALLAKPNFVYVGRGVPRQGWISSRWGNPFKVGMDPFFAMRIFDALTALDGFRTIQIEFCGQLTAEKAVECYEHWIRVGLRSGAPLDLSELRGKVLGCWCCDWDGTGEPARPCHAVVLARLADQIGA